MAYKDKEKQKEFQRLWRRKYRLDQKLKAINVLGGKCSRCEVTDYRCLEFDHIKPELRKKSGEYVSHVVIRQINTGKLTEKEIQLLCANCHSVKTYEVDRKTYSNWVS